MGYEYESIQEYYYKPLVTLLIGVVALLLVLKIIVVCMMITSSSWAWQLIDYSFLVVAILLGLTHLHSARRVRLRAYANYLEVTCGAWPLSLYQPLSIHVKKVISIHAEKRVEATYFIRLHEAGWHYPGSNGVSKWKGWRAIISTEDKTTSALAIETREENWLIGCPDPDEAVKKLQEIYTDKSLRISFPASRTGGTSTLLEATL